MNDRPYSSDVNRRGEFLLQQGNHIKCATDGSKRIVLDEPFFMCECDDHETKIMVSKEGGIIKNNLLCKHVEH
jgi:hypothetical protein